MITETMTSKGRNVSDEDDDDDAGTTPGIVETCKLQNTDIIIIVLVTYIPSFTSIVSVIICWTILPVFGTWLTASV